MPPIGSARPRRVRAMLLALAVLLIAPLGVAVTAQSAAAEPTPVVELTPGKVLEQALISLTPLTSEPASYPASAWVHFEDAVTGAILGTADMTLFGRHSAIFPLPAGWMTPSLTSLRVTLDFVTEGHDEYDTVATVPVTYQLTGASLSLDAPDTVAYTDGVATATLHTESGTPIPNWPITFVDVGAETSTTVTTNADGVATLSTRGPAGVRQMYATSVSVPGVLGAAQSAMESFTTVPLAEGWGIAITAPQHLTRPVSMPIPFSMSMPPEAVGDTVRVLRGDTVVASATVTNPLKPTVNLTIPPPATAGPEVLSLEYVSRTTPASLSLPRFPLVQVWAAADATITLDPVAPGLRPGDWLYLRAFVSDIIGPLSDGEVQFVVDGTTYTVPVVNGEATLRETRLTAGTHTVAATYVPVSSGVDGPSASTAFVVDPLPVSVTGTLSTTTAVVGDEVTYDILVSEEVPLYTRAAPTTAPDGTVTLLLNGQPVGAPIPLIAGAASFSVPTDVVGTHTVSARYTSTSGDWATADNALPATLTVSAAPVPPVDPAKPAPQVAKPAQPELATTGAEPNGAVLLAAVFALLLGVRLTTRRRSA